MNLSSSSFRRVLRVTHRDVGYLTAALVVAYCLSGVALNHADIWNPDFVVEKQHVVVPKRTSADGLSRQQIEALGRLVGESGYRATDSPAQGVLKIYYQDATLLADFTAGTGEYERISRRPIFYQVNLLHRNGFKPWKWVSDVFAVALLGLTLTGLFVLNGSHGLTGRGKWLLLAGAVPAFLALVLTR